MIQGLDPAASIVEMCGGIARVAEVCGLDKKTVYRWMQPKGPRGGTGGTIPTWHAVTLMQVFPELTPEMFFRAIIRKECVAAIEAAVAEE